MGHANPDAFAEVIAGRCKVDENGCWIWLGTINRGGYGALSIKARHWTAHRAAYTFVVGPIPEGLVIDHLCRNRACCNPDHLEPVTQSANVQRGMEASGADLHCINGHMYAEDDNLLVDPKGRRTCRPCARDRKRRFQERRRTDSAA